MHLRSNGSGFANTIRSGLGSFAALCLLVWISTLEVRAAATPGSILSWGGSVGGAITPPDVAAGQTVAIAASAGHSLALLSTGAVVGWGSNVSGESNIPEAATHDVIAIAAGYTHSMALTSAGQVIVWGANASGQGNVPQAAQSNVIQIAAGDSHCLALRNDGSVVAWGANGFGQSLVPTAALSGITRIAAGAFHSLAVTASGSVVAWGNNLFGQIGAPNGDLPAELSGGVTDVAGGRYHSAFLKSDGSVIALGGVGYGEANVPAAAKSGVVSIVCGSSHTLALKSDGTVVGWGDSSYGQTTLPAKVPTSGYVALAAGETFSLAMFTNPLPLILANPQPLTVWSGRPASMSALVFGGAVQWQRDGVDVPGATSATLTFNPVKLEDAGLYTVIARNVHGSVTSAPPALLTVNRPNPPVIVSSPADMTLREGVFYYSMQCVVGGDDLSFQWTKDGVPIPGRTNAVYLLGTARLDWPGVYALIATNGVGAVTSTPPTQITVLPATPPVITMTPPSLTVSAGNADVVLNGRIEADVLYGYQWIQDGEVLWPYSVSSPLLTAPYTATLNLGPAQNSHAGNYRLRVFSNAGTTDSEVVKVVVTPHVPAPPVITVAPVGATVTQGDSVRFEVVATGTGLSYQWLKDESVLPGKTAASLTLAIADLADAGSYRVRVSNADGSVTSDPPALLVVNAKAPVSIITPPSGAALTAGDPLRLSVVASANTKTYQWKRNGVAIPGATNSTYRLVRSLVRHAGEYTVEISNGFAPVISAPPAVVTVAPAANPVPTGGVVELEPQLESSFIAGYYYDSAADISVPPEAQSGVVAISTFREILGGASPFYSGYAGSSVDRLALLEDGRLVRWGYQLFYNPFSINPYSSQSYSGLDSAPENADGLVGAQSGSTVYLLRANGSISDIPLPDPADEGSAYVAISSALIRAPHGTPTDGQVVGTHLMALRNNGAVVELVAGGTAPASVQSGIKAIAAGPGHSVALRDDGSVVAWSVPGGGMISVPAAMTSQVSSITADELGFGALALDGTVIYQPLTGATVIVPPQAGINIVSGTPAFAITSDRRAVTWDGSRWIPAKVPEWTQGRILQRSGTCLLVTAGAPVLVGTIPDQTVEEVKPVTLSAAGGGAGVKFQWFRDGNLIPGATNTVLRIPNASVDDAGGYTVSISNALGSVTSSPPARLTVVPPPNVGMFVALSVTNNLPDQTPILPAHLRRGVVQVRGGKFHYLTLRQDGSVVGWMPPNLTNPRNVLRTFYSKNNPSNFGQADVPEEASHDVVEIDVWENVSVALKKDGSVIGWGEVRFNIPPSPIRKLAGGAYTYFLDANGGVLVRNGNSVSQEGIPALARSGVVALACQAGPPYALREDGTVVALASVPVPIEAQAGIAAISGQTIYVGGGIMVAAKRDGSLIGWAGDGVVFSLPGNATDVASFGDGTSYPFTFVTPGGAWWTKSGNAGVFPPNPGLVPEEWQGRILQLGYHFGNPSALVALLRSTPQRVQFDAIPDRSLREGPLTLSATASTGLPVSFRVVSGPAVLAGSELTFLGSGPVTVVAEQGGDTVTAAAASVTRTFNVLAATQSVQFAAVPPLVFGSGPVVLSASASSGLPVVFAVVSGPGVVDGNTLTPTGAGVVVVQASQAGDAQNQAASATQNIVVSPAPQTLSFAPLADVSLSATPIVLVATSSRGLPVSFRVASGPAALNGNQLVLTGSGVVTVVASQPGDANTAPAEPVTRSFTVSAGSQSIAFTSVPAQSFGGAPVSLIATSSSGLPVVFTVLSGPGTVAANTLTFTGAGVVVVQASQAGNGQYQAASATQSIVVNPASQTITFAPLADVNFSAAPIGLVATSSRGLPVSFRVASGPATLNGTQLLLSGTGVVTVVASQPGDANTAPAESVSRSFTVNRRTQTITFAPVPALTFGASPAVLSATSDSGLSVSFFVISGPGTINGNALTPTGVGTVVIQAVQLGNDAYQSASAVQTISVGPADQQITFDLPGSIEFTADPITLQATANSGLPVRLQVLGGPGSLNGNQLRLTGTGTVQVSAEQPGDANHRAASVTRSMVVQGRSQSLTVTAPTNRVYAPGTVLTLAATASSGLPVTFALTSGPGTLNGNQLALLGAGVFQLTASQAGSDTVAAAKPVTFQFEVTRAPQTVTFAAIENPTLGPDGIPLVASASSGLAVAFTVLDGPATVQGSTLKLTSLGTVHVAADQAGNGNYQAAVRAVQTLQVLPGLSLVPPAGGTAGRSSLEIFLPAGQSGEVEQCDQLGNWTSLGSVRGAGGDVPATILVIPPPGTASARFWRVRTSQ